MSSFQYAPFSSDKIISNTAIYLFFFTFEGSDTDTVAVGATVISSYPEWISPMQKLPTSLQP